VNSIASKPVQADRVITRSPGVNAAKIGSKLKSDSGIVTISPRNRVDQPPSWKERKKENAL